MRKKLVSILLSIMIAVSFMPVTAGVAFAVGENPTDPQLIQAFKEAQVTGLKQSAYTYNSVTVAWEPVANATGYRVYRADSKDGSYKKIKTLSELEYKDTANKKMGSSKYYKVRAYMTAMVADDSGQLQEKNILSKYSEIKSAKPNMKAPKNVVTHPDEIGVVLTWDKVTGASGYQVYRSNEIDGSYVKLGSSTSQTYTNDSQVLGNRYFYKVRAYRNVDGKAKVGKFCKPLEGVAKPVPPTGVKASLASGGILIKWNSVNGAEKYKVYRSEKSGSGYKKISTTANTSLTNKKNLEAGKTYYYRVKAVLSLNDQEYESSMSAGQERDKVVKQAKKWHGAVEGGSTHKEIVKIYNEYSGRKGGTMNYSLPWCATYVSAVFIKAGFGKLLRCDCCCPSMLNAFAKTKSRTYAPTGGDVIFYDWNYNNVPDHVGMIAGYSSNTNQVTAIEGNTTCDGSRKDCVAYRTFNRGWGLVLRYGIPGFNEGSKIKYQPESKNMKLSASSLAAAGDQCLTAAGETDLVVEDPVEAAEVQEMQESCFEAFDAAEDSGEDISQQQILEEMAEYIKQEEPAEEAVADESVYDAFLVMDACEDMGIEASVITLVDGDGNVSAYNEIIVEGSLYKLDASEEGTLTEIIPEEIY